MLADRCFLLIIVQLALLGSVLGTGRHFLFCFIFPLEIVALAWNLGLVVLFSRGCSGVLLVVVIGIVMGCDW